jgi:hypothetical protein
MFGSGPTDLFLYQELPPDTPLLDPATSPLLRAGGTTTRQVMAMVLSAFTFTKRFVDDLLAVDNLLLPYLTYCSQQLGPITGVYDGGLQLEPSVPVRPVLHSVPYLDLEFLSLGMSTGALRLYIRLYDKRQSDKFKHLNVAPTPSHALHYGEGQHCHLSLRSLLQGHHAVTSDFCWQLAGCCSTS